MRTIAKLAALAAVFFVACPPARAQSDAQGWNGPGWYVTGSAPATSPPAAAPAYILFEGPHEKESGCLEVYNRLYSPIGLCRLLNAKPVG